MQDTGQPREPSASQGLETESERLEEIAKVSPYASGVNSATVAYEAEVFARHWRPPSCLEIGPAEGLMTEVLAAQFDDLTLLEGSPLFGSLLRKRFPRASVVTSLVEGYEPGRTFTTIVLGQVLEHVVDPVAVLARVNSWIDRQGVLCVAVPNSHSLHRQAAVLMELLETEKTFSSADLANGHRRIYDQVLLLEHLRSAGFAVEHVGGFWLKPLANAQIESSWTDEMVRAYMVLGETYPEIAAITYAIARRA